MTQPPIGQGVPRGSAGSPPRPRLRRATRAVRPQLVQLVVTLLFLVFAYQGIIWYWNVTSPREVVIPRSCRGSRKKRPSTCSAACDLKAEVVARKYDEQVPEGLVILVDPKPGHHVKAGRTVRLVISEGSRWSKVPDVQQMSRDRALALLKEAKLSLGKETASYDDKIPAGYVITQTPDPGEKVVRNTAVDLDVSRGPETPSEDVNGPDNAEPGDAFL